MAEYLKVDESIHDFEKTNLVTDKGGYDWYKCKRCGLVTWRYGIGGPMETYKRSKRKAEECDGSISINPSNVQNNNYKFESKKIKIVTDTLEFSFGLKDGDILDTVECPDSDKATMNRDTWVYSETRKAPVKLFSSEFEVLS